MTIHSLPRFLWFSLTPNHPNAIIMLFGKSCCKRIEAAAGGDCFSFYQTIVLCGTGEMEGGSSPPNTPAVLDAGPCSRPTRGRNLITEPLKAALVPRYYPRRTRRGEGDDGVSPTCNRHWRHARRFLAAAGTSCATAPPGFRMGAPDEVRCYEKIDALPEQCVWAHRAQ